MLIRRVDEAGSDRKIRRMLPRSAADRQEETKTGSDPATEILPPLHTCPACTIERTVKRRKTCGSLFRKTTKRCANGQQITLPPKSTLTKKTVPSSLAYRPVPPPIGVYKELVKENQAGELSFANVVTFNMDEYLGLPHEHDQSYWYFMHDSFFDHLVDMKPENINILNGMTDDPERSARTTRKRSPPTAALTSSWAESV